MRISKNSKAGGIAGVVAGILREGEPATLEAIGMETNYTAVKSLALSGEFLDKDGIDQSISVKTVDKELEGNEVTAYVYEVKGTKRP